MKKCKIILTNALEIVQEEEILSWRYNETIYSLIFLLCLWFDVTTWGYIKAWGLFHDSHSITVLPDLSLGIPFPPREGWEGEQQMKGLWWLKLRKPNLSGSYLPPQGSQNGRNMSSAYRIPFGLLSILLGVQISAC